MTMNSFGIIFISVLCSAIAQLSLKLGVTSVTHAADSNVLMKVVDYLLSPLVFLGLTLYGIGAIIWLFALKQVDLSLAYPFVGLGFVLVFIFGVTFLSEPLVLNRIVGSLVILAGIVILSYSP